MNMHSQHIACVPLSNTDNHYQEQSAIPFHEARTQVLKGVLKVYIADGDNDSIAVVAPIEAALLQPFEIRRVPNFLAHQILCKIHLKSLFGDS